MTWLKNICRVCLETLKQSIDIYTSPCVQSNLSYSEMLSTCTKIKPNEHDGLPRKICSSCCKDLEKTFLFNSRCEESNRVLVTYLEDTNKSFNCLKLETDIKTESNNYIELQNKELQIEQAKDILDDFKLEPECDNDDNAYWNADDNLILGDLLLDKKLREDTHSAEGDTGHKTKDSGQDTLKSKSFHQCDICGKFLSTKSNLKQHKVCHTELRPYKCIECPSSFRGYSGLFQHRKMHSGEKSYHCEYCSKQFGRRSGLINHIKIHTGEKQFSCGVCFKTFVQSSQLTTHMKRHQGLKPYLCQECGKGFPIKAELVVHSRVHNGEKPYRCHLCSKTFATSGNLSIHVRFHNKEIRYHCKECKRGFVSSSTYNVHMKRHKGQKDHLCECGKTFYTSSSLKQHRVVHTGEKKYQCKICNRQFTQSSHLTRHFKKVHSKPNAPLPPTKDFKRVVMQNALLQPLLQATAMVGS